MAQIVPPLLILFSIALVLPGLGSHQEPDIRVPSALVAPVEQQPEATNPAVIVQEPPACTADGSDARVAFEWQPQSGGSEQWLDVSTDKTFPRDRTRAAGPFPPGMSSFEWQVQDGAPLYWRISAKTNDGWSPSPTYVIAPCAAIHLSSNTQCGEQEAVQFSWQASPLPIIGQWLDVSSFDTGFTPGTFESVRVGPGESSVVWNELPGDGLLWRVNTLTPKGWRTSEVQTIATCDQPMLLTPNYSCSGGRVVVEFHWARAAQTEHWQVIDLSLRLNGFEEGSYAGSGYLPRDVDSHVWPGLYANVEHFYRVNALTPNGWRTSVTRSFIPTCPDA
jgi:hypothetical protein